MTVKWASGTRSSTIYSAFLSVRGGTKAENTKSMTALPQLGEPTSANDRYIAWLQCLGSFCLFFNCWGTVNSFGAFQTFYTQNYLPTTSPSAISWIGSLQAFLLCIGGIITGPLYDYGFLRALIAAGSFLVVFGMLMTSLATTYWQILLSQGVVVGLGNGCLFVPCVSILPAYFPKSRALAMGIAASGSGFAGVIIPIIFHKLQPSIGFAWAARIIAFTMLATLVIPLTGMKMHTKPTTHRGFLEPGAWKEPPFSLCAFGMFFGCLGLYIPLFYVQIYAIDQNIIGDSKELAFYLLAIVNAGSFFGRIIPNHLADRIGPLNTMIPISSFTSLLAFTWITIATTPSLIIFCVLYGFVSVPSFIPSSTPSANPENPPLTPAPTSTGAFLSLTPTVTATLCPSLSTIGVQMGMMFGSLGMGVLIGNPVAGALLKYGGWVGLQAFCGGNVALGTACFVAARVVKRGWEWRRWV